MKNLKNILLYHDSTSTEFFFGVVSFLATLNTILIDKDLYYIPICVISIIQVCLVATLNLLYRNRINVVMIIVFTSYYLYEKIYGEVDANKEGLYICIVIYIWAWIRTQNQLNKQRTNNTKNAR